MATKFWFLFSVAQEYDQPDYNMVGFWLEKPDLQTVAKAVGFNFPANLDGDTLSIVKLWSGEAVDLASTRYRLETHAPGVITAPEEPLKQVRKKTSKRA